MERKLVTCEHCQGTKTCTASGGRSCRDCLAAAGRSIRQWGTVRCSFCGGTGNVWIDEADSEAQPETEED